MTNDSYEDRRKLTFEQAEGAQPLPTQLQTKELSEKLRSRLWLVVHKQLRTSMEHFEYRKAIIGNPWKTILHDYFVIHLDFLTDEFIAEAGVLIKKVKIIIIEGEYTEVYGFLQYAIRHRDCPVRFSDQIAWALKEGHAAYRVLDGKTIAPIGSDAEFQSLQKAFADLANSEFYGARGHLHSAGASLTIGDYKSSVRESIHSVESVARTLAPSGELGKSLATLEKKFIIHKALKIGFASIYGYTSDEKGIRHPLLDNPSANVDEADALFMIGACAAFVSYMIHKARLAGLINGKP